MIDLQLYRMVIDLFFSYIQLCATQKVKRNLTLKIAANEIAVIILCFITIAVWGY